MVHNNKICIFNNYVDARKKEKKLNHFTVCCEDQFKFLNITTF